MTIDDGREKPKDEGRCKLCDELPEHVIHYLVDVRHYHKFQPKEDAAQASPNRELVEVCEDFIKYWRPVQDGYYRKVPYDAFDKLVAALAAYRGSQKP